MQPIASARAQASAAPVSVASTPQAAPAATAPLPSTTTTPDASPAPESFKGAAKAEVTNAVGLGCEARSLAGWLELLCRKKNGTGGHPIRAIRDLDALERDGLAGATPTLDGGAVSDAGTGATSENADGGSPDPRLANLVLPSEQGELRVLVPWRSGLDSTTRIEWSDTRYDLTVRGESASLVLPVSLEIRKRCEGLRRASQTVIDEARKRQGEAAIASADTLKLPRFGICQMAGLGAWAVTLGELSASGSGEARNLAATLNVVHLDPAGAETSTPFGTLEFSPGALQLPPLMVYDYDDDGEDEVIIRHEITRVAPGKTPLPLPAVYAFSGGVVVPYAKLDPMGPGGVSTEQLEFDMRPDIADYGPYVAWLGSDCGARACPGRIVGPRFFAHSTADGAFSRTDESAMGALKRACAQAPTSVVALDGKNVSITRTATLVACARVWGVTEETITKELNDKRSELCGSDNECPLFTALSSWAKREPPARLPLP